MVEPPKGVHPGKAPSMAELDALSDDELELCVRWWVEDNSVAIGVQFWLDELARRRTRQVLPELSAATAQAAQHVAAMAGHLRDGAEQNAEVLRLNRTMARYTTIGVAIAIAALLVAVLGLL